MGTHGVVPLTNPQIIRSIRNGNSEDFSIFYTRYWPRIYGLCLKMTGDPIIAEDLAQQGFLQTFRKIDTFRGDSAFYTWLHPLAVNEVLQNLRNLGNKMIRDALSLDELNSQPREDRELTRGDTIGGGPDPKIEAFCPRDAIAKAVAQLPRGYRKVFILYHVQGFEHSEIATILGCSEGNCKSQASKARARLRELLGDYAPGRKTSAGNGRKRWVA